MAKPAVPIVELHCWLIFFGRDLERKIIGTFFPDSLYLEVLYLSRIDRVGDVTENLMTILIKGNFKANQSEGDKLSVPHTIDKVVLLSLLHISKDKLRQNSISEDKTMSRSRM